MPSTPAPMTAALPNPDDKLMNWVAERDLRDTMEHERIERIVSGKHRSAFVVMTCVAVAQIAVLLVIMFWVPGRGAAGQSAAPEARTVISRLADDAAPVTRETCKLLEPGSSYVDACRILGAEGHELARCRFDGEPGVIEPIDTVVYAWINPDGSSVHVTFQNNQLVSKAHAGLP